MIDYISEGVSFSVNNENQISAWIESTINKEGAELGAISVIFCSDKYLLELNKKHLQHDYYTDIITFDYTEQTIVSGDLFISVDRTKENANNLNTNELDEIQRVIIHGTLHLLGYDHIDETEADVMERLEIDILSSLNIANPYLVIEPNTVVNLEEGYT